MPQISSTTPMSTIVTDGFIDKSFSTSNVPVNIVTTPNSTPLISNTPDVTTENKNIAEAISETVENYVERGNLETPCELVVNIVTKNNVLQPEIQVEPAIVNDGDALKAT